jgi:hypothetical protein
MLSLYPKAQIIPSVVLKMLVIVQKKMKPESASIVRPSGSCLQIFVSAIASKTRTLTSAAALPLSTATLNLKARLSRSYSTAATKRSLFRLTAFAKSQRGNQESRSCELPRGDTP